MTTPHKHAEGTIEVLDKGLYQNGVPRFQPYRDGIQAAKDGLEIWDNPYSDPCKPVAHFQMWLAGWCAGKKAVQAEKSAHDAKVNQAILEHTLKHGHQPGAVIRIPE